jgi:fructokinase
MVLSFGEVLIDCLPGGNVIGGAPFNVAIHLKRLGEASGIISKIGKDELGDEIKSFLIAENVDKQIQIDDKLKTGYVTVTLNNGQPSYTIHRGTGWEFVDYIEDNSKPNYLVFGSLALHFPHNKASFEKYLTLYPNATRICDINLRTPFYDNDTIDYCLQKTNILKINDEELEHFAKENNLSDPVAYLDEKYNINKVILTKGADGAEVFWEGEKFSSNAGTVNNLKDTVGAGDSFTSMFIYGLLKGIPVNENLKRASDFSAYICETSGAIPSDKSEYTKYIL